MKTQSLSARPQTTTESKPEPSAAAEREATEPSEPEADLPLDVVFGLLSNERRRRVLRYLLGEPETTLGDLAEHVAAIENDKPERALTSTERKRVYICLYQCHLPKLDDAGAVDFDENRKTVTLGEDADPVVRFLPVDGDSAPSTAAGRTAAWPLAVGTIVRKLPGLR